MTQGELVCIPEGEKRQGWKRRLWGYTTMVLPSGQEVEVDAFPAKVILYPTLYLGYCLYEIGWQDTLIWGVGLPIAVAGIVVLATVTYIRWKMRREVTTKRQRQQQFLRELTQESQRLGLYERKGAE